MGKVRTFAAASVQFSPVGTWTSGSESSENAFQMRTPARGCGTSELLNEGKDSRVTIPAVYPCTPAISEGWSAPPFILNPQCVDVEKPTYKRHNKKISDSRSFSSLCLAGLKKEAGLSRDKAYWRYPLHVGQGVWRRTEFEIVGLGSTSFVRPQPALADAAYTKRNTTSLAKRILDELSSTKSRGVSFASEEMNKHHSKDNPKMRTGENHRTNISRLARFDGALSWTACRRNTFSEKDALNLSMAQSNFWGNQDSWTPDDLKRCTCFGVLGDCLGR